MAIVILHSPQPVKFRTSEILAQRRNSLCTIAHIALIPGAGFKRSIEISSDSGTSFQVAIEAGIKRAEKTLKNVKGAWIAEQKLTVKKGAIVSYRVIMRVSFVID